MLAEALEHLVRGIVDNPDDVSVRDKELRRGSVLEVRVHPDDLGRVIGRGGRTAKALRTVVGALADGTEVRVDVPYISGYEIESVDNVSVALPGAAVLTNQTTGGNYFLISPSPGNCTLVSGAQGTSDAATTLLRRPDDVVDVVNARMAALAAEERTLGRERRGTRRAA